MILYHGGFNLRLDDTSIVTKRGEYGSGLYLTTSIERAKTYAKGQRSLYQVTLYDDLKLFGGNDKVLIPYQDIITFSKPLAKELNESNYVVSNHVNCIVFFNIALDSFNYKTGFKGMKLVNFLKQYCDGMELTPSYRDSENEKWIILYNLSKIKDYHKMKK